MKLKSIARHTVKHVWKAYIAKYLKENPEAWSKGQGLFVKNAKGDVKEVMTYKLFREIIERFFDKAKVAIINGEAVRVPCMGAIAAKRIQRDFRAKRKAVNWGKSVAKGGEKLENGRISPDKLYHHTDDTYARICWWKPKVTNIQIYRFEPTNKSSGTTEDCITKGFKTQFAQAMTNDPYLKFRYIYAPLRTLVDVETNKPL